MPAPALLPIFRSLQQAEILTLVLTHPEESFTLDEIVARTGAPYASVHREISRAQSAGLLSRSTVGRTMVITADTTSPYFASLSDLLTKSFGPPAALESALADVSGVAQAFIFGSWAERLMTNDGTRPVKDIDLLVLGDPDRAALYDAASQVERRIGREVQVSIRPRDWIENGSGQFHATVTSRPMLELAITA